MISACWLTLPPTCPGRLASPPHLHIVIIVMIHIIVIIIVTIVSIMISLDAIYTGTLKCPAAVLKFKDATCKVTMEANANAKCYAMQIHHPPVHFTRDSGNDSAQQLLGLVPGRCSCRACSEYVTIREVLHNCHSDSDSAL